MVPIKQLHVKLLLYAEGKKKTPKNTLAKIMPVLLAPLSSKYILIIETSFSKAYWDWFQGHRQEDIWDKEAQISELRKALCLCNAPGQTMGTH